MNKICAHKQQIQFSEFVIGILMYVPCNFYGLLSRYFN